MQQVIHSDVDNKLELDGLKDIYNYYVESNNVYCEGRDTHKRKVTERFNARVILHNNRSFIGKYLNDTVENLADYTTEEQIEALTFKNKFGRPVGGKERLIEIKQQLIIVVVTNRIINNIEKVLKKTGEPVSYDVFKFITKRFNKYICEEILRGYSFGMIPGLGKILIKIKDPKPTMTLGGEPKFRINWGESKKLRQRIIDEGGTPYNKKTAPNGQKWHIYHTEPYPYVHWMRSGNFSSDKKSSTKNRFYCKFKVSDSLLSMLHELIATDKTAELKYVRA